MSLSLVVDVASAPTGGEELPRLRALAIDRGASAHATTENVGELPSFESLLLMSP